MSILQHNLSTSTDLRSHCLAIMFQPQTPPRLKALPQQDSEKTLFWRTMSRVGCCSGAQNVPLTLASRSALGNAAPLW